MKYTFMLSACVAIGSAGAALADCPDPTLGGPVIASTGAQLLAPQSWDITADGAHLSPCLAWAFEGVSQGDVAGYLPEAPTIVFDLEGMEPHILIVRAQTACDPILSVRSSDGAWHFGQPVAEQQEATLWSVPNGPLQVWVGAKAQTACDGQVELETYDR